MLKENIKTGNQPTLHPFFPLPHRVTPFKGEEKAFTGHAPLLTHCILRLPGLYALYGKTHSREGLW